MFIHRRGFMAGVAGLMIPPARGEASVRIFLCGDVMTGRGVDQILPHPAPPRLREGWATSALDYVRLAEHANGLIRRPVGFDYIWGEAIEAWRRARPDVRLVNLETSVTASEDFADKGINYRMGPGNVGCLLAARPDACALANNHVMDFGRSGLTETLASLKGGGLKPVGAGTDLLAARAPAVIEAPGRAKVAVIAMGAPSSGIPRDWAAAPARPGVNLTDLSTLDAAAAKQSFETGQADGALRIVSIHWGPNWGYEITPQQRRFAHALIDEAGASIVWGHSSHHPKAIEIYRGRLILYGCGDFIDDYEGIEGHEAYRSDLAVMYFADLDARSGVLVRLSMTPLRIRRMRLQAANADDVAWLTARLDRECRAYGAAVKATPEGLLLSRA
ncbi:MAG TPA: CapA family protein [Caulobacteraceae bacterium]|nr:CapA family protein [Caulobacteraceae bacterium]